MDAICIVSKGPRSLASAVVPISDRVPLPPPPYQPQSILTRYRRTHSLHWLHYNLILYLILPLCLVNLLREGFIRKKKRGEFSQLGGGIPKCWHFHNFFLFFFACSNSSISAIKIFFEGGRGTPWPKYFENLDNFQLNIEFLLTILGFQGRIFLHLHKMFFGSWS